MTCAFDVLKQAVLAAVRAAVLILLVGFAATVLIHGAPGFGTDERELDARFNSESMESFRKSRPQSNFLRTYAGYLSNAAKGDFGISTTFDRPVAELIQERASLTWKLAGSGLLYGWIVGLMLAGSATVFRGNTAPAIGAVFSGLLLALPSALIAFAIVAAGAPVGLGIAGVVAPRVFRYARNLFQAGEGMPHVTCARAKGLSASRVFTRHVLPVALPELIALAGTSVTIALGAAIPVEVIADLPGIAQLAWKAALGRDLYLLVNITAILTAITLAANAFSDIALSLARRRA